jgi:hypothetical protein
LVSGLEGRDGVIAQSFFSVYGPFLAEHASSRTHEKLPSIVERLLAKEQWSGVAWFVDLAKAHEDVLDRSEREDGFTNLEEKASARAEAYDDKSQPPAELLGLLALLRAGDEA